MVIDEEGVQLGVMPTSRAIEMAFERELDLVEVSPIAKPPVCKIIDYGKFQYQQSRNQQKTKKVETKGIRLSLGIGQHDIDVRRKQTSKFLGQGHNVKIELKLKGREKAFRDRARDVVKQFLEQLDCEYKLDKPIDIQGSIVSVSISKK
jgi:translation initiation factor IF-3